MTKRQFWTVGLAIGALLIVLGPIGYFSMNTARINREAEIRKTEIQAEAVIERERIRQDKATERTQERWEWTQRLPGFKKDGGKVDGDSSGD